MEKELNSIDNAIAACENIVRTHSLANSRLLIGVLITLFGFFSYFVFSYQDSRFLYKEKIRELNHRYEAARSFADTLYKLVPDSARKKSYSFSTALNDATTTEPDNKVDGPAGIINYGIYLFGIVIISILTALYRLHLKEIAKAEQNLTAFYRIRIAANNSAAGFDSDVRNSLTNDAFYCSTDEKNSLLKKTTKIESPLPGHPSSDIVTALLNKILDSVEFKPKQ